MVRDGSIKQLTEDHSLVATMVREGLLTSQEAETHPRRNVLQRSMGVAEDVEIDVRGPIPLREGDIFILCSDGLHGVVKETEMKEVADQPIEAAADEFVRRALERGAPDNVTVIVARVETVPGDPGDEALDETLTVDAPDPMAFDETVKDTQPVPVLDLPAPTPDPPAGEAPAAPAVAPTEAPPAPAAEPAAPPKQRSVLRWTLVALVLVVAGAWFYWNH
jgi:protein phosphatase